MCEPIEIKILKFTRCAGLTEWYSAPAPCGGQYIVVKNENGWKVVFPINSNDSEIVETIQDAADICQHHLNKEMKLFIETHGPVDSKRCKFANWA